jgi:hypothetical protein
MVRTAIAIGFGALALGGCANPYYVREPLPGRPGEHRLALDDPFAQPHSAASVFDWNLTDLCPHGYEKLADRAERRAQPRAEGHARTVYVWEVRCLPAPAKAG